MDISNNSNAILDIKDKAVELTKATGIILLNHRRIATNTHFRFRCCSGREIKLYSEKPRKFHVALRTDGMQPPLTKNKLLSLRTYVFTPILLVM